MWVRNGSSIKWQGGTWAITPGPRKDALRLFRVQDTNSRQTPKTDPIAFSEDGRKISFHLYPPAEWFCNWWRGGLSWFSWFVSLCSSLSDLHQLCTHKIADPVVFVSFAIAVLTSDRRSLREKGVILAQSSRYLAQRGGERQGSLRSKQLVTRHPQPRGRVG